jgi:ectoine hydroxylase-related dioxygenase (phytanoyl-CoA dioxygenase family)
VAVATKVVAFPLKDPVIHAPVIVAAPPSSSHSNGWSEGALHRDFDCIETMGVHSFLLFLDEVTPENSTVAFWRHSKLIGPVDPRHPERAPVQAGLKSESPVGKEGTVHVWDSRLLHRSLANRTQKRRLALQWIVTSAGRNGVSLSVTAQNTGHSVSLHIGFFFS